jgi:hypothetical protein
MLTASPISLQIQTKKRYIHTICESKSDVLKRERLPLITHPSLTFHTFYTQKLIVTD